jgi:TetR/AcrR family transcriptional regulator, mexJK operon transcriptional repressor
VTTRRGRPTHDEARQLDLRVREAAVQTFLEHGYGGASMESIAKAAGITRKSLYARYADKRAIFIDVIPWALARVTDDGAAEFAVTDDLEADLIAFGRMAIRQVVSAEEVSLKRIALNEVGQFPEFTVAADSLMWAARQRACTDLLGRHKASGRITVDDVELAAEHFLALVESLPSRLADFGIHRSPDHEERHLVNAVRLFMHGAT